MSAPANSRSHPSAIHATLGFLLSAAVEALFPERKFFIEHSFIGGYFCHFGEDHPASRHDIDRLSRELSSYVNGDIHLELTELGQSALSRRFTQQGRQDKLAILNHLGDVLVPVARFGAYVDYRFEPMTDDHSVIRNFSIDPYADGFVLRFPSLLPPHTVPPFSDSPKLFQIIEQRHTWGRALHVNNLGQLNAALEGPEGRDLVWVAEGLHEKSIAYIADSLTQQFNGKRVVFISGPSSSGKTTFAKRLCIQLKVNGYYSRSLSMDDYFLDRRDMQPRPDGTLDFESLQALNVERLTGDIQALLDGREIPRWRYDFKDGEAVASGKPVRLGADDFLILEGIHGLNPIFPRMLGGDRLQRIYISAITQLNVDNEHRVSSSDNRLLRRLVRDAQFRGYKAEDTLERWPAVRRGEEQHIFAYQEEADHMFNSALIYELAALRPMAEKVLQAVPKGSPAFAEATRLLTFLSFIRPLDADLIPRASIIREFIGHSAFEY